MRVCLNEAGRMHNKLSAQESPDGKQWLQQNVFFSFHHQQMNEVKRFTHVGEHNHNTHQNQREDVFYKSSLNEMQPIKKGNWKETFPSMQRSKQLQKISLHPYFKAFWGRQWKVISNSRKQIQEVRDKTDGYRHKTSRLDYGME